MATMVKEEEMDISALEIQVTRVVSGSSLKSGDTVDPSFLSGLLREKCVVEKHRGKETVHVLAEAEEISGLLRKVALRMQGANRLYGGRIVYLELTQEGGKDIVRIR